MPSRHATFKTLFKSAPQRSFSIPKFYCSSPAHQPFDHIPHQNAHFILDYSRQNPKLKAIYILKSLLQSDNHQNIDEDTVAVAIKTCLRYPRYGEQLHCFAVSSGFISYRSVSNSLMNFYCRSGDFGEAVGIFHWMDDPDVVSYNTILAGFQSSADALSFAAKMNFCGIIFDPVTYSTILAFCNDMKGFLFGYQLHSMVLKSGLAAEVYVGNALVTLYSRWSRIPDAERVFDEMVSKDLVSWNAILSGYSQVGYYGLEAICAFCEMHETGMKLDHVSFTSAASACGHERNLAVGREVHGLSIKTGYSSHLSVGNVLMSTYAKCEVNDDAKLVFQEMDERNVISWTTMISIGEENALCLFHEMRIDGVYPNNVTLISLLHAVSTPDLADEGRMIHGICIKSSFMLDLNVCNSLVTMYAKFGEMGESLKAFEANIFREIVSWNALVTGYSSNGMFLEALETFFLAIEEALPNEFTFGSVLNAIGSGESIPLWYGQRCHSHLLKLGLNINAIVSGALLDMYAKRGSLLDSKTVFEEISQRSQVTWTTIMSAHARHGDYDMVMDLFNEMEKEGNRPDSITILSVLTACGRKGMVDRGREIFDSFVNNHKDEPASEHYACMVDMLGRAGRLKEAENLVRDIPVKPSLSALQSLLGACRIHGDVEMGQRISHRLMEMEPEESGSYVLMSNLYAAKGDWEKVARIRRKMREKGVRKEIGFSWVDVGSCARSMYMYGFSSGDRTHPRSREIYELVRFLALQMNSLQSEREEQEENL